jgi:hypothetical protein
MASTLPTTAQAIYDRLIADAAILAAIGTYTLPTGETRQAMAVLAANEQLPPGTTVDGIEVVITAVPRTSERVLMTEETLTNPTWRVYISGWQLAGQLRTVADRVVALLPGATSVSIEGDAPGQGIGVIDQIVVRWTNPTVVVTP